MIIQIHRTSKFQFSKIKKKEKNVILSDAKDPGCHIVEIRDTIMNFRHLRFIPIPRNEFTLTIFLSFPFIY